MNKIKHLTIINGSFSLLLLGQFVSQLGDAAYMVGLPWAVYAVTDDFLKVAGVTSVATVTRLLFGWLGGIIADRFPRKPLLCLSDLVRAAAALAVGIWLQGHGGSIWPLYLMAFFFGAAGSIFAPTLFSTIPEVVGEENLFRANSVFTIGSQLTVIGGPVLGGLILSRFGPAQVFLFDGMSFLVSAAFIIPIKLLGKRQGRSEKKNLLLGAARGFAYLRRTLWLRRLAGVSTVSNALTDAPWTVLLPAFIASVSGRHP